MQLFVLALLLGVLIHDAVPDAAALWHPSAAALALFVILPKLALMMLYAFACRVGLARLGRAGGRRALRSLGGVTTLYRSGTLLLYAMDLAVGLLDRLRHATGGVILIDEVAVMAPPLAMLLWGWWVFYPIDRRLREATLISRIDSGLPVMPIMTRRQYLLAQFRHQVLLVFAPMMMLLAWHQAMEMYAPRVRWGWLDAPMLLTLAGSAAIFLVTPLIIRTMWDTEPLPEGELRDRLIALCRKHRVDVRQLLLWRTFGGMINAAVMGLIAPVRYILLTDALLEMLPAPQVEAVMAHEIAHIRRHHLFWLAAVLLGLMTVLDAVWSLGVAGMVRASWPRGATHPWLLSGAAMTGSVASGALALGWVSRRFERQADTFAVQHAASERGVADAIDPPSIEAMTEALQQVADLNHIPTHRRSWRHGSIAWRQAYLRTLVGQRCDRLAIDRQVMWIKLTAIVLGAVGVLLFV